MYAYDSTPKCIYYLKGNKGPYPPPDQLPSWSAAQHNEGKVI